MQIRGNQPSANPSTKSIVQKVEKIAEEHGGTKQAFRHALHEVLCEEGVTGKARSELKLDAMKELKKKYAVLDKHFQGAQAPQPVIPPTRAS